ncbi:MAG TPA: prenyltransferase/squalene oxidase repeat-containing protein [Anaerolineae bacterium]|nr:prenyltransferase/squalene oxidase repeat-containing protein [Anaerolineae bacterium]
MSTYLAELETDLCQASCSRPRETWAMELRDFLGVVGSGRIAPTAYDTAWAARVPDRTTPEYPAFPEALDWLLANQRADGSWGARLNYSYDRVLSTLVAALTLAHWQAEQGDALWADRIESAQHAIWHDLAGLEWDPYDTIGFELILPTLLAEAQRRRLDLPYESFGNIAQLREAKLKLIPPELIYTRYVSTIFSAEFLGDELDVRRVSDLQDANGSIASSPAATAYFLLKDPNNLTAHEYLARVLARNGGAAPAVDPIDVFEPAWVLFNAAQVWPTAEGLAALIQPHVDALIDETRRKHGAGYNSYFALPDLDGTSTVFRALTWAGVEPDPALLMQFEEEEHFRCFPYERNPSISAHVHLLDALRATPEFPDRCRMIQKTLKFLESARTMRTFWFDKWHVSPYYTTAHAVIALREDRGLAENAIRWIVNTQKDDGSWGYYNLSTAEETAYCLQALATYLRYGHANGALASAIRRGAAYLISSEERASRDYTPLWIGKSLYTPTWVVHSAVLSALGMAESM